MFAGHDKNHLLQVESILKQLKAEKRNKGKKR
jgi:hypothetical protein